VPQADTRATAKKVSALGGSGRDRILIEGTLSAHTTPQFSSPIAETGAMTGQLMRRGVTLILLTALMVIAASMHARGQDKDDLDALNRQAA